MSQCICGRGLTRAFEVQSQGTLQGSEKKSTASGRLGIRGQKMNLTLYFFMPVSLFCCAAKLPVYIYTPTHNDYSLVRAKLQGLNFSGPSKQMRTTQNNTCQLALWPQEGIVRKTPRQHYEAKELI